MRTKLPRTEVVSVGEACSCVVDALDLIARVNSVHRGPGQSEVTVEIESDFCDAADQFIITVERKY
jgi:hypothetical protein